MPRPYYITVNVDENQLNRNISRCNNQDKKIHELFKLFGAMTKWDVYDEYNKYIGGILDSSVGRSIKSLCDQGLVVKTNEIVTSDLGQPNTIYRLNDDNVTTFRRQTSNEVKIPKSIKVDLAFKFDVNNLPVIDTESMYIAFEEEIVKLLNRFE
jgi:hypothetical protein